MTVQFIDFMIRGEIYQIPWSQRIRDAPDIIYQTVGARGLEIIREETKVFKKPTGFYKSQLQVLRSANRIQINDANVIYGNWLEWGRVETIFRGYHIWERTERRLTSAAVGLAASVIADMLEE